MKRSFENAEKLLDDMRVNLETMKSVFKNYEEARLNEIRASE